MGCTVTLVLWSASLATPTDGGRRSGHFPPQIETFGRDLTRPDVLGAGQRRDSGLIGSEIG
jgi:hypothetical protein